MYIRTNKMLAMTKRTNTRTPKLRNRRKDDYKFEDSSKKRTVIQTNGKTM